MVRRALVALVWLAAAACGGGHAPAVATAPRGAAAASPSGADASTSTSTSTAGVAVVERVVDGDTIIVHVAGRRERVRLLGIDTPESVKPNTPVQCFAREASARTHALLPTGVHVRLVRDVEERDRYRRLLAYVYRLPDNLFVNLALVQEGYAGPYTFPPNVAHTRELVAAAAQARDAGRGLWSHCGADLPAANHP